MHGFVNMAGLPQAHIAPGRAVLEPGQKSMLRAGHQDAGCMLTFMPTHAFLNRLCPVFLWVGVTSVGPSPSMVRATGELMQLPLNITLC